LMKSESLLRKFERTQSKGLRIPLRMRRLPLFTSCREEVFSETGREVICEGVSMYLLLR
jgi:hypothetical protein